MVGKTTEVVTALEREIAETFTTTTPSIESAEEENSGTVEIKLGGGPVSASVARRAAPDWVGSVDVLAHKNGRVTISFRKY